MSATKIKLENIKGELFLGVDAGSTTTKVVLINQDKAIVSILLLQFKQRQSSTIRNRNLKDIYERLPQSAQIVGACVTGYGEALP
jgi:activator of 2-hydroxyglutaryl-CoA dehydratase